MAFRKPKRDSCVHTMLSFLKREFWKGLQWLTRQSHAVSYQDSKRSRLGNLSCNRSK